MNDESIVHPFKGGVTGGAYGSNNNLTPWNLSVPMGNTSLILEKNSFYVLLPADLETIKNAEKIVVTLEK